MSGYLLDTSVFLWSLANPEKLNRKAMALLEDTQRPLFLSPASSWEISIKWALGKLKLPEAPSAYVTKRLSSRGIRSLPITHMHAWRRASYRRIMRTLSIACWSRRHKGKTWFCSPPMPSSGNTTWRRYGAENEQSCRRRRNCPQAARP
jgi:PIN domain nuclease of toxin-antitoxin system